MKKLLRCLITLTLLAGLFGTIGVAYAGTIGEGTALPDGGTPPITPPSPNWH